MDCDDLMPAFQQAIPASALGVLVNLLSEEMLTSSASERWITQSYLKLFRLEAPLDIPVSQKLPSSCNTRFVCERGPLCQLLPGLVSVSCHRLPVPLPSLPCPR